MAREEEAAAAEMVAPVRVAVRTETVSLR